MDDPFNTDWIDELYELKDEQKNFINNELDKYNTGYQNIDNVNQNIEVNSKSFIDSVIDLFLTLISPFFSEAQRELYIRLGIERYKITAVIDHKTCQICKDINKVYRVKNWKRGVSAPKSHAFCRCTTSPYIEGIHYVKLYRVMSFEEYNSIERNGGKFSQYKSMEEKWFLTTENNAHIFGDIIYKGDEYTIFEIEVPVEYLSLMHHDIKIDGIGPGYCANIDLLNFIIKLWED